MSNIPGRVVGAHLGCLCLPGVLLLSSLTIFLVFPPGAQNNTAFLYRSAVDCLRCGAFHHTAIPCPSQACGAWIGEPKPAKAGGPCAKASASWIVSTANFGLLQHRPFARAWTPACFLNPRFGTSTVLRLLLEAESFLFLQHPPPSRGPPP